MQYNYLGGQNKTLPFKLTRSAQFITKGDRKGEVEKKAGQIVAENRTCNLLAKRQALCRFAGAVVEICMRRTIYIFS